MPTTGKPLTQAKIKKNLIAYLSRKDVKITQFTIQNDIQSRLVDYGIMEPYDTGRSTVDIQIERKIKKGKRDLINRK